MIFPDAVKEYVKDRCGYFGLNKQREISRLVFEIAKKYKIDFKEVLDDALRRRSSRFPQLKRYLLKKRFPDISEDKLFNSDFYLDLELHPPLLANKLDACNRFVPRRFFIEKDVANTVLVSRLRQRFPHAAFVIIPSYKEFIRDRKVDESEYNRRLEDFFIVKERFDFFQHCPCSRKSVSCNYHILNLGYGCGFECAYCILQAYINFPGILIPANIEDFFERFLEYHKNIRLGTGQFTDSLVFDHITGYSVELVNFFRRYPSTLFEFKTKSDNIQLLTTTRPADNIIVSWSINPQYYIENVEFGTVSLEERFNAALKCIDAGYRVGFHFDPIFYSSKWKDYYRPVVEELFNKIDSRRIAWISLGCMRMTGRLKQLIETRFPDIEILNESFLKGFDKKLRYTVDIRKEIYSYMIKWIRSHDEDVIIYLCMEEKLLYDVCGLPLPKWRL